MIRKTQIVVEWEDHDTYITDGPEWALLLRSGGLDAQAVVEIWEHTPENVEEPT